MFGRLTIARKLLLVVSVFVVIVVCVFFLGVLRSEILSGVRAYVGGEGLWSKAEKRAVLSLTKYASTHAESDYEQYLIEIAVPMGDKQARLELERPSPNMSAVARGFIEGRNSPEDVENMASLFRRFGRVGYMAHAINIWSQGDKYIDQLRSLALDLRGEVTSPHPDPQRIQQITDQILNIDTQLTPLEDEFSATLGEGARWISRLLSITTFVASGLLLLIGIALSAAILKQIRNSEEKYRNLVSAANDAILVIDAETRRVLEANNKACDLLAIPEVRLVGMPESALYGQRQESYQLRIPQGFADGRDLELLRADGTRIPVEVSASSTEIAGRPAVLGIFRDIRDRLEAVAVLQRSEERFSDLIQNLRRRPPLGQAILDAGRPLRRAYRLGHRRRHGCRDSRPHLRTVLYHQEQRGGHRPGSFGGLQHRARKRRLLARDERTGQRFQLPHLLPARSATAEASTDRGGSPRASRYE